MLLSMTGFGRGTAQSETKKITVEVKSLNSKQFDLLLRVPPYFREFEVEARNRLAALMQRGKAECIVTAESVAEERVAAINLKVARSYKAQLEEMAKELNLPQPADWYGTLMRLPEILTTEQQTVTESDADALFAALASAADALVDFRRTEGAKLEVFFREKIAAITALLAKVDPFEAERVTRIRTKLEEQLAKLDGIEYDRGRLEQELIFYIEKLDVTEEKTRLRAHTSYFLETMAGQPGQGKKLGFIAQEIGREINTLGSKSNNAEMQRIVVAMKDELEQIKEQVLNVL